MSDFKLSERMKNKDGYDFFYKSDIKEFIKRFRQHFSPKDKRLMNIEMFSPIEINEWLDKLAGEDLE